MKNNTVKAVFCAALGNVIWGFSFLFTKTGLAVAPDPNVMLAHRFLLSSLLMLIPILMGKQKITLKGKDWRPMVALPLLQMSYYVFETYGVLYTNSTMAGLVLAVVPVVTIATGALFLREYPSIKQALFCVVPVVGCILITISGKELGVMNTLGLVCLLLTMLSSAFFKTVNRNMSGQFTAYERTFLVLTISGIAFGVVGMRTVDWDIKTFVAPILDVKYSLSILSLSVLCSIVANLLVNYATGQLSLFKVSSFGALSTLCTALAGAFILKEPFSVSLVIGGILILVGVFFITREKAKQ